MKGFVLNMKKNQIIGISIILIGLLLAGDQLEFWNVDFLTKGWWTIIIIVPSIKCFADKDYKLGTLFLSLGVFLFLLSSSIISWAMFIPYVLVISGIMYLIPNNKKK